MAPRAADQLAGVNFPEETMLGSTHHTALRPLGKAQTNCTEAG